MNIVNTVNLGDSAIDQAGASGQTTLSTEDRMRQAAQRQASAAAKDKPPLDNQYEEKKDIAAVLLFPWLMPMPSFSDQPRPLPMLVRLPLHHASSGKSQANVLTNGAPAGQEGLRESRSGKAEDMPLSNDFSSAPGLAAYNPSSPLTAQLPQTLPGDLHNASDPRSLSVSRPQSLSPRDSLPQAPIGSADAMPELPAQARLAASLASGSASSSASNSASNSASASASNSGSASSLALNTPTDGESWQSVPAVETAATTGVHNADTPSNFLLAGRPVNHTPALEAASPDRQQLPNSDEAPNSMTAAYMGPAPMLALADDPSSSQALARKAAVVRPPESALNATENPSASSSELKYHFTSWDAKAAVSVSFADTPQTATILSPSNQQVYHVLQSSVAGDIPAPHAPLLHLTQGDAGGGRGDGGGRGSASRHGNEEERREG